MNAAKKLPNQDRLKIAHNALSKVKSKFSVEDYSNGHSHVHVQFYDQFDNWSEETIQRATLTDFVIDHYSTVSDSSLGGEHVQYEDTRTAEYYLDENMSSVLVDYLNNRRAK